MIDDSERREAARRLREDAKHYLLEGRFCSNEMPHRLAKAVGCRYMGAGPQISELFPCLADLIDPDTTRDRTKSDESSLSASPIDRDALLELADEIEERAGLVVYASRIRGACGVVES